MMEKIYKISPDFIQNIFISVFNFLAYRERYGGNYKKYLKLFKHNRALSKVNLVNVQKEKYSKLISKAIKQSPFYKELFANIENAADLDYIEQLPIVNKEMFRKDINKVYTIGKKKGIVSKTGGTTGKSLEVLFTPDNMQERFAMLDDFRLRFGYKLGKKTAWFSGKDILSVKDVKKNRFWKTDYYYNVRYYSTFHVKNEYLKYYIKNILEYKPEFLVGFPSTILELAKYGLAHKINFPNNSVKAIFPTAESVTSESREIIELFFKSSIYDQYASSEGAPFIFECKNHNLHLELQSGVFEVLDANNKSTNSGRLIITSFTTEGTPLIRYDIGDNIELTNESCDCGNNNPLVKKILGRINDFIFSPENGKINLGNISNTLKDTYGIVKFQVIQDEINAIQIDLVIDKKNYTKKSEQKFLQNWYDRVGKNMNIKLFYVNDICSEKSGKFRIVKNNIKHFVN